MASFIQCQGTSNFHRRSKNKWQRWHFGQINITQESESQQIGPLKFLDSKDIIKSNMRKNLCKARLVMAEVEKLQERFNQLKLGKVLIRGTIPSSLIRADSVASSEMVTSPTMRKCMLQCRAWTGFLLCHFSDLSHECGLTLCNGEVPGL
eukprot:767803-Hanusia_phi.AAC.6